MRRLIAVLFCAALATAGDARAITMDWSLVGSPGNAADPATGSLYGAVGYAYNIGTYDVTVSQYVAFLNSNEPTGVNTLGLYNSGMSNATYGGITYTAGAANGEKYSAISGDGNHPANYVTFYDAHALRQLAEQQPDAWQHRDGRYTLSGGTPTPSNADDITRSATATVFLPNEDEWYKAAYYNPATSSYYLYPTSSNTLPTASLPTSNPNSMNASPAVHNLTDVGAYSGTTSPNGAYDMGGNIWQWNETVVDGSFQGVRGGSFFGGAADSASTNRSEDAPAEGNASFGFRVASVVVLTPEPSTGVLAAIACGLLWWWRRRFQ